MHEELGRIPEPTCVDWAVDRVEVVWDAAVDGLDLCFECVCLAGFVVTVIVLFPVWFPFWLLGKGMD